MQGALATQHYWWAFDQATGLPNELLAEQLLASDLGAKIESQGEPKKISLKAGTFIPAGVDQGPNRPDLARGSPGQYIP